MTCASAGKRKIWQVAQSPRDVEHLSKSVKRTDLMLSVLTVIKGNTDVNSSPRVIIAFAFMSHMLHHPLSPLPLLRARPASSVRAPSTPMPLI